MSLYYMFILSVIIAHLYICSTFGTSTSLNVLNSDNNQKPQATKTTGNNSNGGLKEDGLRTLSTSYPPTIDSSIIKTIYRGFFLFPIKKKSLTKKTTQSPKLDHQSVGDDNSTRRISRNEDLPNKSLLKLQNQQDKTTVINSVTSNDNNLANRSDSDSINLLLTKDLPNTLSAQMIINNNNSLDNTVKVEPLMKKLTPNDLNIIDDNEDNGIEEIKKDELDKMETHINNHNSLSTISVNGGGNSRHYNTYQSHLNQHYNNNKYLFNSNSFGNNINLNYIHSLLTNSKPLLNTGHSASLSSMLNSNPYGLSVPSTASGGVGVVSGGSSFTGAGAVNNYYPSGTTNFNSQQQSIQKNLSNQQQLTYEQSEAAQPQQQQQQLNQTNFADFFGPSMQQCGKQQVGYREPRIVGGNNTYEGEFPWAVSIQRHGNHHCGGVIVGKRWILTAAHCVRSQLVGNLLVRTGGHTLSRNINSINSHLERDYFVDQIVMHGDFSRYDNLTASQLKSSANTNNADIALLKLRNDIVWNEFAWPVCFPHRESGNFSGADAIVIGWGKLNEKSEDFSNELQKVKLTIIDNKVCQNWFRQAGREMPIDDRIICAGFKNGGKDACHGDSGGPLLSKINGQYIVVGIVSTGIGCARPLLPGLYSRVSSYINWIERYITT